MGKKRAILSIFVLTCVIFIQINVSGIAISNNGDISISGRVVKRYKAWYNRKQKGWSEKW